MVKPDTCTHVKSGQLRENYQIIAASVSSFFVYKIYMERYYDIMDLKTIPMVDVSKTQGRSAIYLHINTSKMTVQVQSTRFSKMKK